MTIILLNVSMTDQNDNDFWPELNFELFKSLHIIPYRTQIIRLHAKV